MSARVIIAEQQGPYRKQYQALVERDGILWSLGCCHLHQTAAAAEKCRKRTEARLAACLAGDERRVQQAPHPVIEFTFDQRGMRCTTRMSPAFGWKPVAA